ncbi:MAG: hypothetical protein U0840_04505 [Gemmataceae bacterium]
MLRACLVIGFLAMVASGLTLANNDPKNRPRRIYVYPPPGTVRPPIIHGNNPRVRVQLPPRLDWSFAMPPALLNNTPREFMLHDSTQTIYQLWVPRSYMHATPHAAIVFVSGKAVPDELLAFDALCRKFNVLFAVAYNGGDEVHPALRMQLTLDVLDDLRRRMNIDTDRLYLAGFSQGARTACDIAYAYPEFVGGVLAISGASSPRPEPWMRERMKDRLSLALMTGEVDPNRREIEMIRFPVLRDLGARARLWTIPRAGSSLPMGAFLEDAFLWMESARGVRRAQMLTAPTLRVNDGSAPISDLWANALVDEAVVRMKDKRLEESGVLQLEGVMRRWAGSDAARRAGTLLEQYDAQAKVKWRALVERKQQLFAFLEARGVEQFLTGPIPARDLLRKPILEQELLALWEQVEKTGADTVEGKEATRRLAELRKAPAPRPPAVRRP